MKAFFSRKEVSKSVFQKDLVTNSHKKNTVKRDYKMRFEGKKEGGGFAIKTKPERKSVVLLRTERERENAAVASLRQLRQATQLRYILKRTQLASCSARKKERRTLVG